MVLEVSGDSRGASTPAGRALPSSLSRSEMPCRALYRSILSVNWMVMTDRPGMDSERMVASPCAPLTAFSIGLVTSCSTCWAVKPGASVWMSTVEGTKSGNTSSGALRVAHSPSTRAIKVRVAMVPEKRTQRPTSQRMPQSSTSVLGLVSRASSRPAPSTTTRAPGLMSRTK